MLVGTADALTFQAVPTTAPLKGIIEGAELSDGECDPEDPFAHDSTSGSEWSGEVTDDEEQQVAQMPAEEDQQDGAEHVWFKDKKNSLCPRIQCRKSGAVWCDRCGCCGLCVGKTRCIPEEKYTADESQLLIRSYTYVAVICAAICKEKSQNAAKEEARQKLRDLIVRDPSLDKANRSDLVAPLRTLGYKIGMMNKHEMVGIVLGLFGDPNDDGDADFRGPKGQVGVLRVRTRSNKRRRAAVTKPTPDKESERLRNMGLCRDEE
jgi:hypothetical protein